MKAERILHQNEIITIRIHISWFNTFIGLEVNGSGRQTASPPFDHIRKKYPDLDEQGVLLWALDHCVKSLLSFPAMTKEHSYETVKEQVEKYKETLKV
jgi:hypothetical protein